MNRSVGAVTFAALVSLVVLLMLYLHGRGIWTPVYFKVMGQQTVADVVALVGSEARIRMQPDFVAAGMTYPPRRVTILAIKDSARLELWAESDSETVLVSSYEIKALSGVSGPKLREGDRQVPEGIYRIQWLNPNSSYHLSLKLNYPNAFDLKYARLEGRTEPGTNIFIHGKAVSIGCLAMGDEAAEELFVLANDVGLRNIRVVIAPTDPRESELVVGDQPGWVAELYRDIENEFGKHVRPEQ